MPEPQPISCGSISQGRPERSTNRMPVRAARSGSHAWPATSGLGPLGRQQRLDDSPQIVRNKRSRHAIGISTGPPRFQVLLGTLSYFLTTTGGLPRDNFTGVMDVWNMTLDGFLQDIGW
jgi:hypothetical protein